DVDVRNSDHETAVSIALNLDHADVARELLRYSRFNFPVEQSERVLVSKVTQKQPEMVKLFLEKQVNPDAVRDGMSPLLAAALFAGDGESAKLLLAAGAKPGKAVGGLTPLAAAAVSG